MTHELQMLSTASHPHLRLHFLHHYNQQPPLQDKHPGLSHRCHHLCYLLSLLRLLFQHLQLRPSPYSDLHSALLLTHNHFHFLHHRLRPHRWPVEIDANGLD